MVTPTTLPQKCKGPLNAAPWLCGPLAWHYVVRQPITCCGMDVVSCPIRAGFQLDDGHNIITLQSILDAVANDASRPAELSEPD